MTASTMSLQCAITMPAKAILEERMHEEGFTYFLEKTKLADRLGGQKLQPLGVATIVEQAFLDFGEEVGHSAANILYLSKNDLIGTLLQDSPPSLEYLAKRGLYEMPVVTAQKTSKCECVARCRSRIIKLLQRLRF